MKALDTPVLQDLLRGRQSARKAIQAWSEEELATTELTLFDLEVAARVDPRPGRERRLAALDRLRRKVSVLPVDARAVRWAGEARAQYRVRPATALALGILESTGVTDWLVGPPKVSVGRSRSHVRLVQYHR
ncbi:MAG: type II toxin-antitoxin system VapC family toxin [Thermoplasmata archaeon]